MNTSLESRLQARALMFKRVRQFFEERDVLEVDCPALSPYAPIDLHIDVMSVQDCGYLHTSPEYGMKRLLADGSGDIYQMSHVFRKEEKGALHNPEFTMIEWYRLHLTEEESHNEVLDLIYLFIEKVPCQTLSYQNAYLKYTNLDPFTATPSDFQDLARTNNLDIATENFLWGTLIEPHLQPLTLIYDFPPAEAALAKIENGLAKRFEIYNRGIELANGYHELTDPIEQKRRLEETSTKRQAIGKPPLQIDPDFLAALQKGLPECFGVAVGFDRLLMLQQNANQINDIF